MRYTLFYTNHHGKEDWEEMWIPQRESISFKTLKEAREYLAIMKKEENAYIYDNVTKKIIKTKNMPSFYQRQEEIFEGLIKDQLDKSLELDSNIEANSYKELIEKAEKELSKIKNNIVKNE